LTGSPAHSPGRVYRPVAGSGSIAATVAVAFPGRTEASRQAGLTARTCRNSGMRCHRLLRGLSIADAGTPVSASRSMRSPAVVIASI